MLWRADNKDRLRHLNKSQVFTPILFSLMPGIGLLRIRPQLYILPYLFAIHKFPKNFTGKKKIIKITYT